MAATKPAQSTWAVTFNQEGKLQIIEIKKLGHRRPSAELDRIIAYCDNIEEFLNDPAHGTFRRHCNYFHVTVVCDSLGLNRAYAAAIRGYHVEGNLAHTDWAAFLLKSGHVHQDFLEEARRQRTTGSAFPDRG